MENLEIYVNSYYCHFDIQIYYQFSYRTKKSKKKILL